MKIYIIKASAAGAFKDYKQFMGAPPQSIYSLAAATPDWVEVDLIDETSQGAADLTIKADLIAIFMSTPDAYRGYHLADEYRKQGKAVIFGGLHASFMSDEVLEHSDAVIIGEAETVWPDLLNDFTNGGLKTRYHGEQLSDLSSLRPFPHEYMDLTPYGGLGSVVVSRGCKFKCSYCTVHRFFDGMHNRPVDQVIDEIRKSGLEYIELHADNLIADREYAFELFEALKPLNIKWVAEATINIAEHDDLLEAAAQSGLFYLLSGLETPSRAALKAAGKGFIKIDKTKEYISKLHEYNIAVDSAMLFGFDEHNSDIFEETLAFVEDVELDVCHSVIITPYPGTTFYQQLEDEQRLLTKDWSLYDGTHAVFQPKQMTPQALEEGQAWFYEKYNSLGRSLKRSFVKARNIGWINSSYF
ncbi:B12-binding domain-containing radical SAM protein [Amphritea japonica]|uniref:Radical SAM protein n=1 Tax=Amphritea japonica ATCC BAA-1530 TaxID=1278309 RepID=A0A7R6PFV2_9GAMM|nr:radical SAM protein [Amphritea japonica]BBB25692.1 radical SAM protein [Amphritea japonica ATCC BAA-1530]